MKFTFEDLPRAGAGVAWQALDEAGLLSATGKSADLDTARADALRWLAHHAGQVVKRRALEAVSPEPVDNEELRAILLDFCAGSGGGHVVGVTLGQHYTVVGLIVEWAHGLAGLQGKISLQDAAWDYAEARGFIPPELRESAS